MLAHLEHLNFTTLLEHLDRLHVGLLHSLDCNLLSRFQVRTKLDQTELTFTKSVRKLVKLIDIREIDGIEKFLMPVRLDLGRGEVQNSRLIGRKDNFYRIVKSVRVRVFLRLQLFDERSRQAVHHAEVVVLLISVTEYLITAENCEVLLKPIGLGL